MISNYYNLLFFSSTDCKYTAKAANVRKRGGRVMLLAYDSNVLSDEFNVDDVPGGRIDIPTIIITKEVGEAIKEYLSRPTHEKVGLSIKFTGANSNGLLDLKMFFRSDDVKALSFFKEFSYYKDMFLDRLRFTPVYKYNIYYNEEKSDELEFGDKVKITAPCVKKENYCVSPNNELQITNPRYILLENIRQSCIFSLFELTDYWNYMELFGELCGDPKNPTFTPECSRNVLRSVSLQDQEEDINKCMTYMVQNKSKIEDDYNLYNKQKIYRVPELVINNVKYKGDWYSKYIFNAICNGFIENHKACATPEPEEIQSTSFSWKVIIYSTLIIVFIMLVLLICYKRYVNISLETTLNERIEEQAMKTLGNYKAFKDKGGKPEDFVSSRSAGNGSKLELVSE